MHIYALIRLVKASINKFRLVWTSLDRFLVFLSIFNLISFQTSVFLSSS